MSSLHSEYVGAYRKRLGNILECEIVLQGSLIYLLSGKLKNPFESNPLFNAIYSMQKSTTSQETEKCVDEDFFEEP